MIRENRIKYFAPADYSERQKLDRIVRAIIEKTRTYEVLEKYYEQDKKEMQEFFQSLPKPSKIRKRRNSNC